MGWFWGASSGDKKPQSDSSADPLRDLDPSLQAFLKKESPVKYTPSTPPTPTQSSKDQPQQSSSSPPPPTSTTTPAAPPTLFKDGRYAHLWSTYTPQADVEAASKSEAEKIADVLEGYKVRKAAIGRAALENCALEQEGVNECYMNGGVVSRLTMCRAESRSLERCVMMQQKFLKALGYLSTFDRPAEVDERIQMHADTLYHRMLDQEKAAEEAAKEGRETPKFAPLIEKGEVTAAVQMNPIEKLPLSIQEQIKEKLEGLSGIERELQEKALQAEVSAGQEVKANLKDIYKDQEEQRRKRREEGRETIVDRFTSMLGGEGK